jgi:hypothetical protein
MVVVVGSNNESRLTQSGGSSNGFLYIMDPPLDYVPDSFLRAMESPLDHLILFFVTFDPIPLEKNYALS